MFKKGIFWVPVILLLTAFSSIGQQVIALQNPSFEDYPRKGSLTSGSIKSWVDCGLSKFPTETPPDIHPVPTNAWEVSKDAYDGKTFLGMVVRYNDSWESLSQALSSPIQAGTCYSFAAYISQSDQYVSATTRSDQLENFVRPAVFLIWGGNFFCDKAELLGESPPVTNLEWKQYKFLLQPQRTHKYITIEAFYKTPILEAYNGHILVDGLSDLEPVECPLFPTDLIAKVSDPPAKVAIAGKSGSASSTTKSSSGGNSGTVKSGTISSGPKTFTPVITKELVQNKMFVGQKIRLNELYFKADSVNLLPTSYKVLDELAEYMLVYPNTTIEIGGHTNTIPTDEYCNQLSTERAKAVHDYLIDKGVPAVRLKYKGYGKTEPLIAYDKYNREARLKNQRVEIKILTM